ncbi:MAG: hypothetical protein ACE5G1_07675 [bacterium]
MAGGTEPVWSPDGKELFYKQENKMIAATLETDLIVRVAKRAVLFEKNDFVFDPYDEGGRELRYPSQWR